MKPDEFPTIANNNYREAHVNDSRLIVSEEPSSPIVNFGYRGLDSQRSEFMQVLKDGSLDQERAVRFSRDALHPDSRRGRADRVHPGRRGLAVWSPTRRGPEFRHENAAAGFAVSFYTKNAFGTRRALSGYTAIDGTIGQFGYYVYFDHRQRDGFRDK